MSTQPGVKAARILTWIQQGAFSVPADYCLLERDEDLEREPAPAEIKVTVGSQGLGFAGFMDWVLCSVNSDLRVTSNFFTQKTVSVILYMTNWITTRMCFGTPPVPFSGSGKASACFSPKLMGIFLLTTRCFG